MGLLALLTVTAVVVATVTLATRTDDEPVGAGAGGGPIVVVLPFQSLGSSADSQYLATGISQELILNLMRFPSFRLYTLPTGPEESSGYVATRQEQESGATYAVIGSVQMNADEIYVTAQLQLAATGLVLWSESFHRPPNPEALIEVQRDLAGKIASKIGSPYGAVNKDLERWLKTPTVSSMQSYICVLRAYRYRRSFSQEAYDPVLECLNETVRRDPYYSDAWAMLGWLHLDAGRFEFAGAGNLQKEYEEAFNAASRAVSLQPENTLAIKALASVNHYMGRYDEAERLSRRAVQLNPYDPDALAQLGWRLAVRGNFEEGIPILNKAIERTVNPPGWYFLLIAIDLYLKGDYPQMLQVAERSIEGGTALGQAMLAIASGALGNAELARTALKRMSEFPPLARDPASYFRRNGATDEITDALVTGLAIAQQVANEQPYRQ